MLSVMVEKGLLARDENKQPLVFRAVLTRERAGKKMVNDLIDKVFNGSSASLVLQALSTGKATPEELLEVRRLLDEMDGAK